MERFAAASVIFTECARERHRAILSSNGKIIMPFSCFFSSTPKRLTTCLLVAGTGLLLSACDGDSDNSSGTPAATAMVTGEPLSCNGNRMWGPLQDPETPNVLDYVSESFGNNVVECAAFWEYNPTEVCSDLSEAADGVSVTLRVQADGSLRGIIDGETFSLPPADISVDTLRIARDC